MPEQVGKHVYLQIFFVIKKLNFLFLIRFYIVLHYFAIENFILLLAFFLFLGSKTFPLFI